IGGLEESRSRRNLFVDLELALWIGGGVAELDHAVLAGLNQIYGNAGLWLSGSCVDHHAIHRQQRQRDNEESRQRFHRDPFLPVAAAGLGCIFSISATTTASSFCKESLV